MEIREIQEAAEELIFIGIAHNEGLLKELYEKPDTVDGITQRMGYDRRVCWTFLEALVEMKYLDKNEDIYSVPEDVYPRLIDTEGDSYEGDFWKFLMYLINPWRTLPYALKNGEPDISSYEGLSLTDFIKGMNSPWKKKLAPEIIDICLEHCPEAKSIADIGGAPGTMAKEFASRGLKTIVYDLPDCIDVMADKLAEIDNIEIVKGDATESLPEGKYDIAFLGNLCHGQSPEDNQKIISMCHDHLNENGIVVVFDNLRNESYLGARLALHMITQSTRGDIYTREQYLGWIEDAGFREHSVKALSDSAWHLIIAKK